MKKIDMASKKVAKVRFKRMKRFAKGHCDGRG
jgi:hypothetical protein